MLLLSAIFQQYNGLPELFEDWKRAINNKLTGNVLDILKQQTMSRTLSVSLLFQDV
jgi:hypothetical protein